MSKVHVSRSLKIWLKCKFSPIFHDAIAFISLWFFWSLWFFFGFLSKICWISLKIWLKCKFSPILHDEMAVGQNILRREFKSSLPGSLGKGITYMSTKTRTWSKIVHTKYYLKVSLLSRKLVCNYWYGKFDVLTTSQAQLQPAKNYPFLHNCKKKLHLCC